MWLAAPNGPTRTELAAAREHHGLSQNSAFGIADINPESEVDGQRVLAALEVIKGGITGAAGSPMDLHTPTAPRESRLLDETGTSPPATLCSRPFTSPLANSLPFGDGWSLVIPRPRWMALRRHSLRDLLVRTERRRPRCRENLGNPDEAFLGIWVE